MLHGRRIRPDLHERGTRAHGSGIMHRRVSSAEQGLGGGEVVNADESTLAFPFWSHARIAKGLPARASRSVTVGMKTVVHSQASPSSSWTRVSKSMPRSSTYSQTPRWGTQTGCPSWSTSRSHGGFLRETRDGPASRHSKQMTGGS